MATLKLFDWLWKRTHVIGQGRGVAERGKGWGCEKIPDTFVTLQAFVNLNTCGFTAVTNVSKMCHLLTESGNACELVYPQTTDLQVKKIYLWPLYLRVRKIHLWVKQRHLSKTLWHLWVNQKHLWVIYLHLQILERHL